MDSKENTPGIPPESVRVLLQDIGNRLGASLSATAEKKIDAHAGLSGLAALEARQNTILTMFDALLAQRTSNEGLQGAQVNERMAALELELATAREVAVAWQAEVEAAQGRTLGLEQDNQAIALRLRLALAEKRDLEDGSAQGAEEAEAEIGRLRAWAAELEGQVKVATSQLQQVFDEKRAQDAAGIESRREAQTEIARLREELVVLAGKIARARADTAGAAETIGADVTCAADATSGAGATFQTLSVEGGPDRASASGHDAASLELRILALQQDKDVLEASLDRARCEELFLRATLAEREQDVSGLRLRLEEALDPQAADQPGGATPQAGENIPVGRGRAPFQAAQTRNNLARAAMTRGPEKAAQPFYGVWAFAAVFIVAVLLLGYKLIRHEVRLEVSSGHQRTQLAATSGSQEAPIEMVSAKQAFLEQSTAVSDSALDSLSAPETPKLLALSPSPLGKDPGSPAPSSLAKEPITPVRTVIPFGLGSVTVQDADAGNINELAARILAAGANSVLVLGYTDSSVLRGDLLARYADNIAFSNARAQSVGQLLVAAGINPRSILAQGMGAVMPLAGNETPENRARNRRVEVIAW